MRKLIPQTVEVYCDVCGDNCTDKRKFQATLNIEAGAYDLYHNIFSDYGNMKVDLCDTCYVSLRRTIDSAIQFIKDKRTGNLT